MINITLVICEFNGCRKYAYYNIIGSNIGKYCLEHKHPDMQHVVYKKCIINECKNNASYNFSGINTGLYCCAHKLDGMMSIHTKRCVFDNCYRTATYSINGFKTPIFCKLHTTENTIKVVHRKLCVIETCNIGPSYGFPGNSPDYCSIHKKNGTIKYPTTKCKQDNCKELAIYGTNIQLHCDKHKKNNEFNLIEKDCKTCQLPNILNENMECNYCDKETFFKFRLAKQKDVKNYLEAKGFDILLYDKMIDNGICIKNRPDFVFESKSKGYYVVLEVDEYQHNGYNDICECTRMINIGQSLGMPTIFLRYNPDEYIVYLNGHKKVKNPSFTKRMVILELCLKKTLEKTQDEIKQLGFCSIIQLFYNGYNKHLNKYHTLMPFENN
jgi:hypothetical protein